MIVEEQLSWAFGDHVECFCSILGLQEDRKLLQGATANQPRPELGDVFFSFLFWSCCYQVFRFGSAYSPTNE